MECLTLLCLMSQMGHNVYATASMQSYIQRPAHEGAWCMTSWCSGPQGELKIGTKLDLTRAITLDLGVLHRSSIDTNRDRGIESLYVSLTWKPFAQ